MQLWQRMQALKSEGRPPLAFISARTAASAPSRFARWAARTFSGTARGGPPPRGGQDFPENGMACAIAGGRGVPQVLRQAVGDLHGDALRRIEAEELKTDRGLLGGRVEGRLAGRAQCQAVGSRGAPLPRREGRGPSPGP